MLYSNILAHARRCAPAESVRLRGENAGRGKIFSCVNISGEPEDYFRMSPEDWLRAEMQGRLWHWSTATPVVCPG